MGTYGMHSPDERPYFDPADLVDVPQDPAPDLPLLVPDFTVQRTSRGYIAVRLSSRTMTAGIARHRFLLTPGQAGALADYLIYETRGQA